MNLEEVSVKFIEKGEKIALKEYLLLKLQKFSPKDKIQITLLATWIMEIFLGLLNERNQDDILCSEFYSFLSEDMIKVLYKSNAQRIAWIKE